MSQHNSFECILNNVTVDNNKYMFACDFFGNNIHQYLLLTACINTKSHMLATFRHKCLPISSLFQVFYSNNNNNNNGSLI